MSLTNFTLITGSSSGIGLELARIFASHKRNLILVARSEAPLEKLKTELVSQHGVQVQIFPMDLSLWDSAKKLHSTVSDHGWHVDTLVNNAGFGDHGTFVDSDWRRQKGMIDLNITALTELTRLFLPAMVASRSGRILNVASTAAFQPGPWMSVYYATKAYVLSFSEALSEELRGSGVTVTALCPGPTLSGFQEAANMQGVALFERIQPPSSREVAEFGYHAMIKGKVVAIQGTLNSLVVQLLRVSPRFLVRKIVRQIQAKRSG